MRSPRPAAAAAVACLLVGLFAGRSHWLQAQAPPEAQPAAAAAPAAQPVKPPVPAPPAPPADSIGSLVGANVTVYLRADAVGTHFNGSNMELRNLIIRRGAFVRADEAWFVLRHEAQETWIPRSSIALVEMRS